MCAATLGVLVAGGRGTRLALGRPKAFAEVGGITLIERASRVLETLCDAIVVTAPPGVDLPPHRHPRIADVAGAAGPLAGMVAGLESRPFAIAIVLGIDFPLLRRDALAALAACLDGAPAVIPAPGGIPQPLVGAYAPAARDALASALGAGERAPTRAVLALRPLLLDDAAIARLPGGESNFFNLNTPSDLAAAERLARAAAAERA